MIHIGLTGGLCTGKSTVAAMFAELGAPVIDADAVVHELLASDPTVRQRVLETFGEAVCTDGGALDRAKLAAATFGDKEKIAALTSILYPRVRERIARWFADRKNNGAAAAIAEVSMLYEGGATHMYDTIVVVRADRAIQLARFVERGGAIEEFAARLKHQMPLEEKEKKASYIINNTGTREATREQVVHLWAALQKKHAGQHDAGKEGA
jgi:dephospho-CoA kinase